MSSKSFGITNKTGPLLLFCIVTLLGGALIGEILQKKSSDNEQIKRISSPISPDLIKNLNLVKVSNSLGDFEIIRKNNRWWITNQEKNYFANEIVVEKMLNSLSKIKVERLHKNNTLNRNYFSLSTPIFKIFLNDQEFQFGLVNSIDDSTYLTFPSSQNIYQIEVFDFDFPSIGLNEILYTKLFLSNPREIKTLKLVINNRDVLSIKLEGNTWFDKRGRKLNEKKVNTFLIDLFSNKSDIVVDENKEGVYKEIDKVLKKPPYELVYTTVKGKKYKYSFSYPVRSLPSLNLERRKNIVLKSNLDYYPIVIEKSFLDVFKKRASQLR